MAGMACRPVIRQTLFTCLHFEFEFFPCIVSTSEGTLPPCRDVSDIETVIDDFFRR
jgi:hypothetical protein